MKNETTRLGYRGYCVHEAFGGTRMPTGVQNIIMRQYAVRHGLNFLGPLHEDYWIQRFGLRNLIAQLPKLEGIIMPSLFVMPDDISSRHAIFRRVYEANASLHFVIENLVITDEASCDVAEEILLASRTITQCPRIISPNLINDCHRLVSFSSKDL